MSAWSRNITERLRGSKVETEFYRETCSFSTRGWNLQNILGRTVKQSESWIRASIRGGGVLLRSGRGRRTGSGGFVSDDSLKIWRRILMSPPVCCLLLQGDHLRVLSWLWEDSWREGLSCWYDLWPLTSDLPQYAHSIHNSDHWSFLSYFRGNYFDKWDQTKTSPPYKNTNSCSVLLWPNLRPRIQSCHSCIVGVPLCQFADAVQTNRRIAVVYFSCSWWLFVESLWIMSVCGCSAASGEHLQHSGCGWSHHHPDVLWTSQSEGGDRRSGKLHLLRPQQRGLGRPADSQYN